MRGPGHDRGHHGGPWGPGPRGGPWGPGGGRRLRRGDIRGALLSALIDGPAHGYEIIRRLEERSGGAWRPSAGSVYPTLQMLEEQGLLSSHDASGKRVYQLTDTGREEAQRHGAAFKPWEDDSSDVRAELRRAAAALTMAAQQVDMAGDDALVERATTLLVGARQQLYQLLAGS